MLRNRGNFMNRISLFRTRIVIEDKVYLLAKDVRKTLEYKSIDQLRSEHSEIVEHIKDLPALVLESDFNTILTSDIEAMKKLKHIEITRVETLRNNTEAIKSIYPLKFMVAGKMFENDARKAGYQSVNEYIAVGKHFRENNEEKHWRNAKYGWYRYDSRFALPVYNETGEIERYNVFHASLIVRHSEDKKLYLYDILDIKKETSNPIEPKGCTRQKNHFFYRIILW